MHVLRRGIANQMLAVALVSVVSGLAAQDARIVLGPKIGVTDSLAHALGKVSDLTVDSRGNIYSIDSEQNKILSFASTGKYRFAFGRSGTGVGEFFVPRALAVDENDHLYVYDAGTQRVTEYSAAPAGSAPPSIVKSIEVGVSASDMCVMDGSLFLFGFDLKREGIIHRFVLKDEQVRSFGKAYGAYGRLAQATLASGRIECLRDPARIVAVPRIYPEVRAYTVDGNLLWSMTLPAYRVTVVEENNRRATFTELEGGFHSAVSAFEVAKDVVVVQLGHYIGRETLVGIETRILSATDGEQIGVQDDLPALSSPIPPTVFSVQPQRSARVETYRFSYIASARRAR